jgi:DNA-binding response OmpR family regulator
MPQRIVVIDDAPEIVELYEDFLSNEGYTVVATFSVPPTDPEMIGQHHPDLIITDWRFYGTGSGMQTVEMIKRYLPTAAVPIIVCTAARRDLVDIEAVLTQYGVRILYKPFAIDDLLTLVQEMLLPTPA